MTIVIANNSPRVSYTVAEGATQTSFAVSFEFFADADLNFIVDGTTKTLTTHYTVSGGDGSTGTITTTSGNSITGITGNSTVVITRSIALERTTDFPAQGSFQISSLNTELDRFTAIAADLNDKANRSIQTTDYDTTVSVTLPVVADRKGKLLAFNSSTGAVEAGPLSSDVQTLSTVLQNTTASYTSALNTKLAGIETSADVTDTANVVASLTAGNNITIASDGTIASSGGGGGSSYTHPNHSGEVTSSGDGATVIASDVVDADNLKVSGNGSNTQFLRSDGDGTFTWATPVDTNTTYSVGDGGLTTNDFTNADHSKLNSIEASATADQTDAEIRAAVEAASDSNVFTDADHSKLDSIAASANNYSHPNHSGEVTSTADGATVIADNVVDEANLKISNTPTNGYVLTAQSGNTGGLTWAAAASGGGADLYAANESSPSAQPSATGTNSIAIGDSAVSTNSRSFATAKSRAGGNDSVALGIGNNSTSYGASGTSTIALCDLAKSSGTYSVALGHQTQSTGYGSIAAGFDLCKATGNVSVALGKGFASASGAVAIGHAGYYTQPAASANGAIAIGDGVTASGLRAIGLGQNSTVSHEESVIIGTGITSTATNQVNIGGSTQDVRISEVYTLPKVDGSNGHVLTSNGSGVVSWAAASGGGSGADLYVANESSPSAQPTAAGANAIGIGDSAVASGTRSIAIGRGTASGWGAASFGHSGTSSGSYSIAMGANSSGTGSIASNGGAFAVSGGNASGGNSAAFGDAIATGTNSFAGQKTRATGADSVAFANGNSGTSYGAQNAYAVSMGQNTKTSGRHGIAMGFVNQATGLQSVAIGYGNSATHSQSFLLGGNISSTASNQVSIGGTQDYVRISETYTLPNVDGSANEILKTDGSGTVSWAADSTSSDVRLKEDIQDETVGLNFVNDLRPVTFLWKKEKDIPEELKTHVADSDKRVMNGKHNHGFIAQEVKAVIDKHDMKDGFNMWKEDKADGSQSLIDASLMPILVNAIKELSAKNDALEARLTTLEG